MSLLPTGCELVSLGVNTGIARAQNVGLAAAGTSEAIAFFDQDSQPSVGLLGTLVSRIRLGQADIVAPVCLDEETGSELPSTRLDRLGRSVAVYCVDEQQPVEVDIVISSGTVATREVFAMVGGLDEKFFIDFVDTEWCLRCRAARIPIRVVPQAIMRHRIGDSSVKFAGCSISIHSPIRCYYQLRNCIFMLRRKYVPILFSAKQLIANLGNRILLLLFVKDRLSYIDAYCCALSDGIRGQTGRKQI